MTDSATAPWDRIDDLESASTQDLLREVRKLSNTLNSMNNKNQYALDHMHTLGEGQLNAYYIRRGQYRAGLIYIAEITKELLSR